MTDAAGADRPVFLTARWERLVMLNYDIDPAVLAPYVPEGTELDAWRGSTFFSLVGFRFLDTRVKGVPIPFHRDFDEINLRFYVRAPGPEGPRRGVVFVREVVPKIAIAAVARLFYQENYVACPTDSDVRDPAGDRPGIAEYRWTSGGNDLAIGARFTGEPTLAVSGSEEEFTAEHYWGYAAQRDGSTVEYRVEHPQWRVWRADGTVARGDFAAFYGAEFGAAIARGPRAAFVAEGSDVSVRSGVRHARGEDAPGS